MNTQTPWLDETVADNGRTVRENFADWFASSRVVDLKGQPIVCYHGTGVEFTVFNDNQDGGHYFSSSKATAEFFAENGDNYWHDHWNPRVIPVFLSIKNPMVLDYGGLHSAIGMSKKYDETDADTIDWTSISNLIDKAKREGHDGMWLVGVPEYNGEIADQWIAFEPHQIKSAVHSRGLYAIDCPDLHDQRIERAKKALEFLDSLEEEPAVAAYALPAHLHAN